MTLISFYHLMLAWWSCMKNWWTRELLNNLLKQYISKKNTCINLMTQLVMGLKIYLCLKNKRWLSKNPTGKKEQYQKQTFSINLHFIINKKYKVSCTTSWLAWRRYAVCYRIAIRKLFVDRYKKCLSHCEKHVTKPLDATLNLHKNS